jgi:hypothetical protein
VGLFKLIRARAAWLETAFAQKTEQDAIAMLYGDEAITSSARSRSERMI